MHAQTAIAPLPELTLLNNMAGDDIAESIRRQQEWGIRCLDLKDRIFGCGVADLDLDQARQLADLISAASMRVHTLSTGIGYGLVEQGEAAFRAAYAGQIERICRLVPLVRPTQVRLLAAKTERRTTLCDAITYLDARHAWLFAWYRETIDRITASGTDVVIENEVGACCLSRPQEVLDFVTAIDRPRLRMIWDIVNLWQMGTYPTVAVYRLLAPVIGMVHLKGGRSEEPGGALRWRSHLATASWPLRDVLTAILADRHLPVLCLNPPHGEAHPEYQADYAADLNHLRTLMTEITA